MKELTGVLFHTSSGNMLVFNEQDQYIRVGDEIRYDGQVYIVDGITAPSRPDGRWALKLNSKRRLEDDRKEKH